MGSGMMLCEVIGTVEFAFAPEDLKLALAYTITDPIEAHVDGLGSLLFDGIVGDTASRAVVRDNGSRALGMAHFFEGNADWAGVLAIVKECTKFGFSSTGDDFTHDLA